MQVVLLGSGGYHPNSRRHTACVMFPELGVLFDAGTAAFRIADYLKTDSLDIFLSHTHLDHVVGLTFLLGLLEDNRSIRVHGEPHKLAALKEHLFAADLFPVESPFDFVDLTPNVRLPQGGVLTWFPIEHPGGCVGYRIDWPDRSMAYVTDTIASATADYVKHIEGVDLLLHEAYFDDDRRKLAELTGHSCITDVAEVAAAAQVGRLVMVHMNPRQDTDTPLDDTKARKIFPHLQFGTDELAIDF